jgi:maleate isomerase
MPGKFGWRGKIGLLVPSGNATMEVEGHLVIPRGVSIYVNRMKIGQSGKLEERLLKMAEDLERATEALSAVEPDVIVYGCTSGSFLKGPEWERDIRKRIEKIGNCKALTTAGAVVSALKKLGIKKVSVATPYSKSINSLAKNFLETEGFTVCTIQGLDPPFSNHRTPSTSYKLAREVDSPEAEGIFIGCTGFRSIDMIEYLESDLKKPVITSNQATVWKALRVLGIGESISGFGSLLKKA